MKKIYFLLVSLLFLSGITYAQDPEWTVKEAVINKLSTTQAIVVDGIIDAYWESAVKHDDMVPFNGEDSLFGGAADLSGYWKAAWDANGIYVLVDVTVDDVVSDGTVGEPWKQDLVEVYFDMNTDTLLDGRGKVDGISTGHYDQAYSCGNPNVDPVIPISKDFTPADTTILSGLSWNGNARVSEFFFPWTTLLNKDSVVYVPSGSSLPIGFDICMTDNDNNASEPSARIRQFWCGWDSLDVGEPWNNADKIGRITFTESPTAVSESSIDAFSAYPVPATEVIYFTQEIEGTLLNIMGQKVVDVKGRSVDVSNLASGTYFIETNNGSTIKVLVQ